MANLYMKNSTKNKQTNKKEWYETAFRNSFKMYLNLPESGLTKDEKKASDVRTVINTFMKEAKQIGVSIINAMNVPQAKGNG